MSDFKDKIGFIGLGNMGSPMAKNLEKAGVDLFVFNRSIEKTIGFNEGSTVCSSIADLVEQTDIIFTMLTNDDAVHAVYETILTGNVKGKLFVDMSTISEQASKAIAETLKSKGGTFIDAPVAGSTQPAKDGTLIFMVGSSNQDKERVMPYLSLMGKEIKYLGDNGAGIAAKLCINYYLSILYQGMAETVLFAEKLGISRENMMAIINESASGSGATKVKTKAIIENNFPPAFALDLMLKDVNLAIAAGADMPMSKVLEKTYQEAHDAGYGEKDVIGVLDYLKTRSMNK
ncbi:NAD(P)-dependent oxidoreductase [Sphingobacterium kyonggiense]|uniref:NAD(P)-dependent oxidoreductase n=1 Tax=Sphingobacterium kyonggiense TaxID=714075 RepID=A0ABP7YU89_9SPHI